MFWIRVVQLYLKNLASFQSSKFLVLEQYHFCESNPMELQLHTKNRLTWLQHETRQLFNFASVNLWTLIFGRLHNWAFGFIIVTC